MPNNRGKLRVPPPAMRRLQKLESGSVGLVAWDDITDKEVFDASQNGLAPLSGGGEENYLRADGTWTSPTFFYSLSTDRTLTSTTSAQSLFGVGVSLALGRYAYEVWANIDTMSATSGNAQFLIGGTATINSSRGYAIGGDTSTPMSTVGNISGGFFSASSTAASAVTAATGTGLALVVRGMFNVATAGSFNPNIALVTAASAVVRAGSYVIVNYLGSSTSKGTWA